jgi:hypothetical protein
MPVRGLYFVCSEFGLLIFAKLENLNWEMFVPFAEDPVSGSYECNLIRKLNAFFYHFKGD